MLNIVFVSDYVCPYCFVAKEAMKAALLELDMEAKITWQPYELTVEPDERVDTYHDEVRKAKYQILVEPCKELGLDMKLPPNIVPRPYSRLAFEGWYYACENGLGEVYNDMMYRAYFVDEKDICDIDVLVDLAESIGLDGQAFKNSLETRVYARALREADDYAKNVLEAKTVPTILVDGKKISLYKYTKEEMINIFLDQMLEQEGPGFACGVDGCY